VIFIPRPVLEVRSLLGSEGVGVPVRGTGNTGRSGDSDVDGTTPRPLRRTEGPRWYGSGRERASGVEAEKCSCGSF
jgi:hypothetical protein